MDNDEGVKEWTGKIVSMVTGYVLYADGNVAKMGLLLRRWMSYDFYGHTVSHRTNCFHTDDTLWCVWSLRGCHQLGKIPG